MKGLSGISLPLSTIVLISIGVIVLVVIVAFFVSSGVGAASRVQQERTFREGCIEICQRPDRVNVNLAALYPNWQASCEAVFSVPRGAYMQCLDRCGCVTTKTPCEYMCIFRAVIDDWFAFCERVRNNPATAPTYGSCKCEEC